MPGMTDHRRGLARAPWRTLTSRETEDAAVQRELAEEAGYEAGRLVKLCRFHSSKSVMEETVETSQIVDAMTVVAVLHAARRR